MGALFAQENIIQNEEDIFYLTVDEIFPGHHLKNIPSYHQRVAKRKQTYAKYADLSPPPHFSIQTGEEPPLETEHDPPQNTLHGRGCVPGRVRGKVKILHEFYLPETIDFDILITQRTDPGWTPLLGLISGLIVEEGGILSHASIVSREMGLPTVVGANNASQLLKDGQYIEIDSYTGKVTIL
ncbi:MAG: hypothetical protein BRC24_01845 [Parcubacteria group bacterium SW_4_46_8]|nr:MAG: hypothetical protein BRC24_01845 [Parcubacteria group bacterium SW_4_46_8]